MSSLRRELTVYLVGGVVVTCLLAGWLLWVLVRTKSRDDFDAALLTRASALASLLTREGTSIEFAFDDQYMPEFHRGENPEYFQVWIKEQRTIRRSLSLGLEELPRQVGALDEPEFYDLDLLDGKPGRAVGITSVVDYEHDRPAIFAASDLYAEIVVAVSTEDLRRSNAAILRILLLSGGVLLITALAVVWFAIRRCNRRLRDFTDQLGAIDAKSLSARIDTSEVVTELKPLGDTTNLLLQRLQSGFDRERRMTSNIAHELRTPVTELRTAVDVARRWPDDTEAVAEAIDAASRASIRMSSIIESLLRLGRLQADRVSLDITTLNLASMAQEVATELAGKASEQRCHIEHEGEVQAVVQADAPLARVLVRNLLQNAVEHAPTGSRIVSEWRRANGFLRWRVANPASGLSESDVLCLAEPFWRKDEARSGEVNQGLGLALCQAICAALGWRLKFALASGQLHVSVFVRCPSP